MAETVNSNVIIYNDLAQTAYLERIQDNVAIFNEASRGTLQFVSEAIVGNTKRQAFYVVGGSIVHRDVNDTGDVTTIPIGANEMVSVKVPWAYGPYATTEEAFKRRGRSPAEFSMIIGQDMADALMAGWLRSTLAALNAAIRSNPAMVVTGRTIGVHGKKVITRGLRAFGDKMNNISALVMDAATYLDFVDQAVDTKGYGEFGTTVYGGSPGTFGIPVITTDACPADTIFGLQQGAALCTESQAPGVRSYDINDKTNLAIGYRGEGTFNLEIMGYSYLPTVGGINPTNVTLARTDVWDKYATSNKATAGFVIDLSEES